MLNLLCCPDKVQGPLSPVLETVKKKFSSLACSKWQGQAGRAPQAHHHSVDEGSSYLEAIKIAYYLFYIGTTSGENCCLKELQSLLILHGRLPPLCGVDGKVGKGEPCGGERGRMKG